MDDVLGRACPACSHPYGLHTLVSLAVCVESILCDIDDIDTPDDQRWWATRGRPVETVTTRLL